MKKTRRKLLTVVLILTMALTMIFEIMGKNISGKFSFVSIDYKYAALGSAPYIIIVLFVSAVVFYFIFNHTKFSYHMRAVGSNEAVSRNAGIHVQRVKVLCFVIGSLFAVSIGSADDQPVRLYGGTDESWELRRLLFKPLMGIIIAVVLQPVCNMTIGIFISQFTLNTIFIGLIALDFRIHSRIYSLVFSC